MDWGQAITRTNIECDLWRRMTLLGFDEFISVVSIYAFLFVFPQAHGEMLTHWLVNRDGYDKILPEFAE